SARPAAPPYVLASSPRPASSSRSRRIVSVVTLYSAASGAIRPATVFASRARMRSWRWRLLSFSTACLDQCRSEFGKPLASFGLRHIARHLRDHGAEIEHIGYSY